LPAGIAAGTPEHGEEIDVGRRGELRWENADDGEHLAVEREHAAKHGRIGAETALPQTVGEDDEARGTRLVLLGGEVAAETRWQPDDGKEWGGHLRARELFGFPSAGERVVAAAEAGEGGEGAVVALVILEAGPGHRGALGA